MKKINNDIAEICGAIVGDGWIQKRGCSMVIAGHMTEDRDYYNQHFISLFSKNFIKVNPKEFPYWRVYGFGMYKKKFVQELSNLGIPSSKKVNIVRLPQWIFNSKKEIKYSFLRGLFDTDGCIYMYKSYGKWDKGFRSIYHHKPRIVITSVSKDLIYDLIDLGKEVSINFKGPKIRKGGFKYNKNNSDSYILEINKIQEIINWFEKTVKPKNPKHITKYLKKMTINFMLE